MDPRAGRQARKLTPDGLDGRRKTTALIRRTTIPNASRGAVDRAMQALGLSGIRRDKARAHHDPRQGRDPCRGPAESRRHYAAPRSHLGDGRHLLPDMGGVGRRRVHRRCLLPTDRRLARADHQARRPRDDPAADGTVGTRPTKPSDPAEAAAGTFGRRVWITSRRPTPTNSPSTASPPPSGLLATHTITRR